MLVESEDSTTIDKNSKLIKYGTWMLLPLQVANSNLVKYLALKQHVVENEEHKGRALCVTNISYDCTKDDMQSIFARFGEIESITLVPFQNSVISMQMTTNKDSKNDKSKINMGMPTESQSKILQKLGDKKKDDISSINKLTSSEQMEYAIVLFVEKSSMMKALYKSTVNDYWGFYESHKERGISQWISDYKKEANIDCEELQEETNRFLAEFDENELKRKREVEEEAVTDSDGWVTVTANSKMRRVDSKSGKAVGVISTSQNNLLEKRAQEKKKELSNFYKFQNRDYKKKHLDELQERFEQDKKRVEKMKAARKFIKL